MSSLSFEKNYALGSYQSSCQIENRTEKKYASFSLKMNRTITLYSYDPEKNQVGNQVTTVSECKVDHLFNKLIQTKSSPYFSSLIIPARTHTLKDLLLDFFIPLTRREFERKEDNRFIRIAKLIGTFILDLLTCIIRFFTILPTYRYHKKHPHEVLNFVKETNVEALYVKSQVVWDLVGFSDNQQEGISEKESASAEFFWRVDPYAPLSEYSLYETTIHTIRGDNGKPYCLKKHEAPLFGEAKFFGQSITSFSQFADYRNTLPTVIGGYLSGPQLIFI